MRYPLALVALVVVCLLPARASDLGQKDVSLIDSRLGPENFRMTGGQDAICNDVPANIPCSDPTGVTSTIEIPCPDSTIQDLDLLVQITHTWVGDLSASLAKVGSGSVTVFDRPGQPHEGPFGCSGDDIDALINDEASDPIEDECAAGVPTIQGEFIGGDPPDDTLMATWAGQDICGTWNLKVVDHAGADTGFLTQWCLIPGPPDVQDDGGSDGVPSSTGAGVIVMILLLLGSCAHFLGRKSSGGR